MRLDKFLCELEIGTRSEVKEFVRKGQVSVNGFVQKKPETKIDEGKDIVCFQGRPLRYQEYVYYMLNKPMGVVSATKDKASETVLSLLPAEMRRKDLFPVGRLDKDTEGLLLLTNDGALAHHMLSPKHHVSKTYEVTIEKDLSNFEIKKLEGGVDIGDDTLTLPAKVEILADKKILLTIYEGRFHQVKRMLLAVGNGVTALKRISFGPLSLDKTLDSGMVRTLSEEEINSCKGLNAVSESSK